MVLEKFYGNDEDKKAKLDWCHYIGHLENEHTACVAMTGCVGSQDVQFTILSKHSPKSSTFKWTKDGNIENMKVLFHLSMRVLVHVFSLIIKYGISFNGYG